jgi:hypothetical protein
MIRAFASDYLLKGRIGRFRLDLKRRLFAPGFSWLSNQALEVVRLVHEREAGASGGRRTRHTEVSKP